MTGEVQRRKFLRRWLDKGAYRAVELEVRCGACRRVLAVLEFDQEDVADNVESDIAAFGKVHSCEGCKREGR